MNTSDCWGRAQVAQFTDTERKSLIFANKVRKSELLKTFRRSSGPINRCNCVGGVKKEQNMKVCIFSLLLWSCWHTVHRASVTPSHHATGSSLRRLSLAHRCYVYRNVGKENSYFFWHKLQILIFLAQPLLFYLESKCDFWRN